MQFDFVKEMDQGIMMDYVDDKFMFIIKDYWSKEEIRFLKKNKGMISVAEKHQLPIFIVQIEEGLESSDCVFCLNSDNQKCLEMQNYQFEILIFNEHSELIVKRFCEADKQTSLRIYEILHHVQMDEDETTVDEKIVKISALEPFELEEMTDLHIKL